MNSILIAVCSLLAVLVALDLLLTVGILRKLRSGASVEGTGQATVLPQPGHRIKLPRQDEPWDPEAVRVLSGNAVIALVVPGCSGCERLHRDLDANGELPLPLYVMGQPYDDPTETASYLAGWHQATPLMAPLPFDELESLGRPESYPTVFVIENGKVAASGYRLSHVTAAMNAIASRTRAVEHA